MVRGAFHVVALLDTPCVPNHVGNALRRVIWHPAGAD